jgi:hypothetical protein
MATYTLVTRALQARIQETVSDARAAAAGLGRDAIVLAESASLATGEPKAGALRQIARDLRNRSSHAALSAIESAAHAGQIEGLACALDFIEQEHAAQVLAAQARIAAEAERDAKSYRENEALDPELRESPPEQWAASAFDAWHDDAPDEIEPLSRDEAKAWYLSAFLLSLRGES